MSSTTPDPSQNPSGGTQPGQQPAQPQDGQQPAQPPYSQPQPTQPQYGQPQPQPAQPQYGQQPDQGQAGFPQAPAYPGMPTAPGYTPGAYDEASTAEPPTSIVRAAQLMLVGAGISVVNIVVTWATRSQLRDEVARLTDADGNRLTASQVDSLVSASMVIGTITGLIAVALWIWMASANRAGRSWARIVATVLGLLNVMSLGASLAQGRLTPLGIVVSVVSLLLAVVILYLLWRPESSKYYVRRSSRTLGAL